MKIGSLSSIINEASSTFKRFPFGIISALAGTACALALIETDYANKGMERMLIQLILTFSLGMVASVGTDIFNKRYYVRNSTQIIFNFLILALMMLYYKTLPNDFTDKAAARTFILFIAAHLGVAIAPFVVNDEPNGFWQYNKALFIRFLTSSLYSAVLFIGISLALLAIQHLFKVNIPDKLYFKIWLVIAGVFNTWFFLAGVPRDVAALETEQDYPKGLKIFTQYVLLPLITVYLLILYAYTARIIITHDWPVGWVCYLVIGFSVAGILALLLVWPLRDDETHRWIKTYTRNFYFALLPLIVLLFVAIGKRIAQYGITENRYFIIVLAIWLLSVALYFLISPRKRIKVIPASLFCFLLIAGFGPWNAFSVSQKNQFNRLEKIFERNGWIKDGKINPAKNKISFNDDQEICATIDYLINTHGIESVQRLFKQDIEKLCNKDSTRNHPDYTYCILESIGLKYVSGYETEKEVSTDIVFSFNAHETENITITGYDYLINYTLNSEGNEINKTTHQRFVFDKDSVAVELSSSRKEFSVLMIDSSKLELNLGKLINKLIETGDMNQYDLKPELLTLQGQNSNYRIKLIISSIGGNFKPDDNGNQLNYLQGRLMIGKVK